MRALHLPPPLLYPSPLAGDIRKVKVGNDGTAHALYEFKPRPELTTAVSVQINTIDMSAPKMGFAVEYNP